MSMRPAPVGARRMEAGADDEERDHADRQVEVNPETRALVAGLSPAKATAALEEWLRSAARLSP
jgi:hypothetical protein